MDRRLKLQLAYASAFALSVGLVAACSGFSPASETDSAMSGDAGGGSGVGPFGALPSGYCCDSDEDCRFRRCVQLGAVKMCLDQCSSQSGCDGLPDVFRCDESSSRCEPVSSPTSCRPASTFRFGTGKIGDCCQRRGNATAGSECTGNHCNAFGALENPYICSIPCEFGGTDCPSGYQCLRITVATGVCAPVAERYGCPAP
jgi:hypothetical protein